MFFKNQPPPPLKIIYFSQMLDIFARNAAKHLVFSALGKKLFLREINEVFSQTIKKSLKFVFLMSNFSFFLSSLKTKIILGIILLDKKNGEKYFDVDIDCLYVYIYVYIYIYYWF